MKTRKNIMGIVLTMALMSIPAISFASSAEQITEPASVQVKKTLDLTNYSEVQISSFVKVVYTQADTYKAYVTGNEEEVALLETRVAGNRLELSTKTTGKKQRNKTMHYVSLTVHLQAPQINKVDISGAGSFHTEGDMRVAGNMNVTLSGAASFHSNGNISVVKNLSLTLSGAGSTKLESISVKEKAGISLSGAGSASIKNLKTDRMDCTISGAGNADIKAVDASESKLTVSGAGKANMVFDGKCGTLSTNVSGASHAIIAGTVARHTFRSTGASHINASELTVLNK